MDDRKSKTWDTIVKVILVIIIILLLLSRFTHTIDNGGNKEPIPTGNETIIEFKCDKKDNDCQPVNPVDPEPIEDNKPNNNNNNNKSENENNNPEPEQENNNGNEEPTPVEPTPEEPIPEEPTPEEPPVEELSNEVEVFDKDKNADTWSGSTNLNIFKDSMYVAPGMIAPESENTYKFVVKNGTSESIKYNIDFVENNPSNINMKYKLKKNGEYIISEYVSYDELNLSNMVITSGVSDTYLLEWKWVSSSNDNEIGKNGATYGLQINVDAESV